MTAESHTLRATTKLELIVFQSMQLAEKKINYSMHIKYLPWNAVNMEFVIERNCISTLEATNILQEIFKHSLE